MVVAVSRETIKWSNTDSRGLNGELFLPGIRTFLFFVAYFSYFVYRRRGKGAKTHQLVSINFDANWSSWRFILLLFLSNLSFRKEEWISSRLKSNRLDWKPLLFYFCMNKSLFPVAKMEKNGSIKSFGS